MNLSLCPPNCVTGTEHEENSNGDTSSSDNCVRRAIPSLYRDLLLLPAVSLGQEVKGNLPGGAQTA